MCKNIECIWHFMFFHSFSFSSWCNLYKSRWHTKIWAEWKKCKRIESTKNNWHRITGNIVKWFVVMRFWVVDFKFVFQLFIFLFASQWFSMHKKKHCWTLRDILEWTMYNKKKMKSNEFIWHAANRLYLLNRRRKQKPWQNEDRSKNNITHISYKYK